MEGIGCAQRAEVVGAAAAGAEAQCGAVAFVRQELASFFLLSVAAWGIWRRFRGDGSLLGVDGRSQDHRKVGDVARCGIK